MDKRTRGRPRGSKGRGRTENSPPHSSPILGGFDTSRAHKHRGSASNAPRKPRGRGRGRESVSASPTHFDDDELEPLPPPAAILSDDDDLIDTRSGISGGALVIGGQAGQLLKGDSEIEKKEEDEEDEEDQHDTDDLVWVQQSDEAAAAMRYIIENMNEEQTKRYETYRRSHLPKASVKKHIQSIIGTVPPQVPIIVAGAGKLFVGDIVERAKEVMDDWGHFGPIRPEHIREAYRKYRDESNITTQTYRKTLF
ncbi:transcription initiation factor TFIID subunit 11 [Nowakowskiella sp. JEL0078]|nr:transcription initiation factor TFIID subunit 11 [Nowakowskiella sp. JEL0078]